MMRVVMVGDVDAGKSTILGRLLLDLNQVAPAKVAELEASSSRRGVPIEYSFLLDSLQVERDQAITLDTSHVWLRVPDHEYEFVDAPGHRELIRNLLSGASEVDAALLVVDATEQVTLQTRRYALFLRWLGVTQLVVAVNKLDAVPNAETAFRAARDEIEHHLNGLGSVPLATVPVAARDGANLAERAPAMAWWEGPSLLESLALLHANERTKGGPLRFTVQDVYRRGGLRYVAGRVESGTLRAGERLTFWPLQASANVQTLVDWPNEITQAAAGQSVALTLSEHAFVDRGAVATGDDDPPELAHAVHATIVWLSEEQLREGAALRMRIGTREVAATIRSIECVIDPETLERHMSPSVGMGDVADIRLETRELLALDDEGKGTSLGRFVLLRDAAVVAGGRVHMQTCAPARRATNLVAARASVTREERARFNNHAGAVIWLTGLPSAGKSTIAMAAQRILFDRGCQVYVLDGDALRGTLNADLGFSHEERSENVRRAAAVAAILADGGIIALCALISPFAADRGAARALCGDRFHEIYVACDAEVAEARDAKGHYRRARRGEIEEFTGVSSPYEAPATPNLVIDTTRETPEESAARLVEYVERQVRAMSHA